MREENGERDYLVGAQPAHDPTSFVEVVKEAFLLEHDCIQNQDIAEVLGVDKSRISQIFGKPEALKPESIEGLLAPLKSPIHRRRIVTAWVRECFGEDAVLPTIGPLTGSTISEKTVRRVDRQIRESRLTTAAKTAFEAAHKADDLVLRERLLDRAFFARQRLDEVGAAMGIARLICLGGIRRGEVHRAAAGHLMRARVLRTLPDSKPEEVFEMLNRLEATLAKAPPLRTKPPYVTAEQRSVQHERVAATLAFMERGSLEINESLLNQFREQALVRAKQTKTYQERSRQLQIASRATLLLGNAFEAEELLEQSFEAGSVKNLNAYEVAGVLNARIKVRTESLKEAKEYLSEVVVECARTSDLYHHRIAQVDLAGIESRLFPDLDHLI